MDAVRLRAADKGPAAEVLARAFLDYPLFSAYFPDRNVRIRQLPWYFGCMITYGLRYGEVYASPDLAGVAIWLPPSQTRCTTWRYIRSGFFSVPFRLGFRAYLVSTQGDDYLVKVHQEVMPAPHWYLWLIGTDPDRQGQGVGTSVLLPVLAKADAQERPCYLETHNLEDVSFYQKRGFRVIRPEQVPGLDLRFWCMLREPGMKP